MTTLTSQPLAPLLDHLFAEADASDARLRHSLDDVPTPDPATSGYLEFYGWAKEAYLAVSRETGRLLYLTARSTGARAVVEFGTSFGLSTLHLAAAVRDNGGGLVVTTEFEPSKVARARENLVTGGVDDLVDLREGDALDTLARDLPERVDLVLLDGAKELYPAVLAMLEDRLRPGALVIADNAAMSAEYLERVRSPAAGYLSVPFGGDVELTMRTG